VNDSIFVVSHLIYAAYTIPWPQQAKQQQRVTRLTSIPYSPILDLLFLIHEFPKHIYVFIF